MCPFSSCHRHWRRRVTEKTVRDVKGEKEKVKNMKEERRAGKAGKTLHEG